MVLEPQGSSSSIDAIAFNAVDDISPKVDDQLRLAYRLDVNEFRNKRNLQLMVEHAEIIV